MLLGISVYTGYLAKLIELQAIACIAFAAAIFWLYGRTTDKYSKFVLLILSLIAGFIILFHKVPGVHNLQVISNYKITPDAIPYTMYLNFDKAILGVLLATLAFKNELKCNDCGNFIKDVLLPLVLCILSVTLLAIIFDVVKWAPKFPDFFAIWFLNNLLIVCFAEEAFFRGFLQQGLGELLHNNGFGKLVSLVLASACFGIAYHSGGEKYMLLAGLAGMYYGWAFLRSKNILGSIFVHCGLNICNLLLFTYPALA